VFFEDLEIREPDYYLDSVGKNSGDADMVTVMWANEAFDKDRPDTYFEKV
jgi:hypothetical protein